MIVRRVLVLLAGVSVLAGCSSSPVTSDKLNRAVGASFARLYTRQQHETGEAIVRAADGAANCSRSAADSPHAGAGDDWTCIVNYPLADGSTRRITYDLEVRADGCYTASGPAQIVGPQHVTAADGSTITNPLFQFDGCFDVS